MRACTKCGVVKPLEAFPPVRRGEPRLQTWCRTCFADYGARYYSEHRETARARLRANFLAARAENKRQLIEYLQAHPCIDCGETNIIVLEFDHVRDKRDNIATLMSSSRTWPRILAEVQKCEVRCANCHRLKTAQRRGHRPRVAPVRSVVAEASSLLTTSAAARAASVDVHRRLRPSLSGRELQTYVSGSASSVNGRSLEPGTSAIARSRSRGHGSGSYGGDLAFSRVSINTCGPIRASIAAKRILSYWISTTSGIKWTMCERLSPARDHVASSQRRSRSVSCAARTVTENARHASGVITAWSWRPRPLEWSSPRPRSSADRALAYEARGRAFESRRGRSHSDPSTSST